MARVTTKYAQELAEQGLTPFMDFTHKSPRGYRGAVQYDGHNGRRNSAGRWAGEGLDRKRWTTALVVPALDALGAMAKQHGVNRCVIAEALLLHPQAAALVADALKPASAPVEPEPTGETKRRKRLTKEEAAKLDEVLLELIQRDLLTKEQLQRVAEACGQKVATVAKRASVLRKGVS